MGRPDAARSIRMTIKKADYNLRSEAESAVDEDEIPPGQGASTSRNLTPTHSEGSPGKADSPVRQKPDPVMRAIERLNERLDRMEVARLATDKAVKDLLADRAQPPQARPEERQPRRRATPPRAASELPPAREPLEYRSPARSPAPRRRRRKQRERSPSTTPDPSPSPKKRQSRRRSRDEDSPDARRPDRRDERRDRKRQRSTARRRYDGSPEELARAILSSSRKGLRQKRGVDPDYIYPYELIERGLEKKSIKRGEATYFEYVVALRYMENQSAFRTSDIPALREHSMQVMEDAKVLPWPIVRQWSEEVFDRIADGRIPKGWKDPVILTNTRLSIIQIAAIHNQKNQSDQSYGRGSGSFQTVAYDKEDKSSGKPCGPWNRAESQCTKATKGRYHVEDGLKLVHMCAYCAYKLGRVLPHSEAICSNKKRNSDRKPSESEKKGFF